MSGGSSSAYETLVGELSLLIRARYPFIYIISHEEERVITDPAETS